MGPESKGVGKGARKLIWLVEPPVDMDVLQLDMDPQEDVALFLDTKVYS